jgi:TPP-dependent pyruvate/acetoin dehydrogenase alpha subunit
LLKEIEDQVVWEANPQITTIERENIDIRTLASRAIYRTRAEVEEYRKKEPIGRFRLEMVSAGKVIQTELDGIDQEVKQEIAEAVQFAKDSPAPDPATAMDYIYA